MRGVNNTLDAVITPLNVAANYVDRISKGDIPPQITDTYKGDFNTIKNNLNLLIEAMQRVTAAAEEIAHGNLTVRIQERSAQDKLMQALTAMVDGLTRTVTDIKSVAGEVSSGSQAISTGVRAVVQGRQHAGGVGGRGLLLHGADGLQYQAERRQRAADRKDRRQIGGGCPGGRPLGGSRRWPP